MPHPSPSDQNYQWFALFNLTRDTLTPGTMRRLLTTPEEMPDVDACLTCTGTAPYLTASLTLQYAGSITRHPFYAATYVFEEPPQVQVITFRPCRGLELAWQKAQAPLDSGETLMLHYATDPGNAIDPEPIYCWPYDEAPDRYLQQVAVRGDCLAIVPYGQAIPPWMTIMDQTSSPQETIVVYRQEIAHV